MTVGTSIFNCVVEVQNTREDSYHYVNILQEEECARFGRLMDSIAAQVNRDNPGMKEQVRTTEACSRKAYVRGSLAAFLGFSFPLLVFTSALPGCALQRKPELVVS